MVFPQTSAQKARVVSMSDGEVACREDTMEKKHTHKDDQQNERLAPGLDGVEGLNADATPEDVAEGNTTQVTKLEYDEYDPSEP